MTGRELYARFCGVNYVRNGRDVETDGGLDCWGFVRAAWSVLGMAVPPPFLIDDEDLRDATFGQERKSQEWLRLKKPEPWALCLISHPSHHDHCGIVSDDARHVLHMNANGLHIIPLDAFALRNYGKEYYRYCPDA